MAVHDDQQRGVVEQRTREIERRVGEHDRDIHRLYELVGAMKERLAVTDTRMEAVLTTTTATAEAVHRVESTLDDKFQSVSEHVEERTDKIASSLRWAAIVLLTFAGVAVAVIEAATS